VSGDGRELTVTTAHGPERVLVRRVFDARPMTDDELARGRKLTAIRPPARKPFPRPDTDALPDKPAETASEHFDRAVWHESRQQWKDAEASYRAAIKIDPDFLALRRRLAISFRVDGNLNPNAALAEYREIVRRAPTDFGSWYQIGIILEGRQDHRGAVAALCRAAEEDTRPPHEAGQGQSGLSIDTPSRLGILNALGYNLREIGELEAAEKEFRAALRLVDDEKAFTQAMQQWPRPTLLVTNLAVCLMRQKEATEVCEGHVKRLAALIPKDAKPEQEYSPARNATQQLAQGVTDIGEAFLWADDWTEAVAWSDKAIERWAEYYKKWPLRRNEFHYTRSPHWVKAVALNWLGKGKEAVAEIDESIKVSTPEEQRYQRMMRARYVAQAGDHAGAVKAVKAETAAGNTNVWDAAVAYSLGVRAAKGDAKLQEEYAKEAVALLRKALDAGENGYPWRKDADLNPLRERDDFRKLMAELDVKSPPVKEVLPPPRADR
jgi:tetratricopeptide (TPR) repeat protein